MEYTETGIIGEIEPMCKIRFLSDPKPEEEYVAVPVSEMIDLIADQMKLMALDAGGVDNWSWYSESISDFLDENECETIEEVVEKDLKIYLQGE